MTRPQRAQSGVVALVAHEGWPSVPGLSPRTSSAISSSSNRSRATGFGTPFVHNVTGAPQRSSQRAVASRVSLTDMNGKRYGEKEERRRSDIWGQRRILIAALSEDELYFNAGSLTASMVAKPHALEALEQPIRY
jgi:hypothetical protein